MRVSDRAVARNYLKHLYKSQSRYSETLERLETGKRFTKLSDDVSAGTRVLRTRMDRYKAEKQLENAQEANGRLKVTEDNFMAMETVLITIHENRVVKALNDPTASGREVIAAEIRSMMAEFLQYANATYGKMFNFGGTNAYTGPFTANPDTGKLMYNGVYVDSITKDPVTGKLMSGSDEVPMDDDIFFDIGLGILMSGPEVNNATAFKVSYSGPEVLGFGIDDDGVSNNIYNVLYKIQENLADFDRAEAEKYNTKLHTLLDRFRINLTDIGVNTKFLDATEARLKDSIDNYTQKIDDLMGTNDEEEASRHMMNDYVLKAVLQLGSRVLPLSLMDFVS